MFHPVYVTDGVYLRTETGEQIGRLDPSGSPFETLDEAREHAVWLEMLLNLQRSKHPGDNEVTHLHRANHSHSRRDISSYSRAANR